MNDSILSPPNVSLAVAAQALKDGELVVFPTETVYGLGANAWNAEACAQIYATKERPTFNPLIVHVGSLEKVREVAAEIPAWAEALAHRFWPGPLTLVLPKQPRLPALVTAGLDTVAVRIPRHAVAQALLAESGVPIAAPSANRFTRLSPTKLAHARSQLSGRVKYFLDGGPTEIGLESTIVGVPNGVLTLLRAGGITREAIESIIGPVALPADGAATIAPGNHAKHYSPQTPLFLEEFAPTSTAQFGLVTVKARPEDYLRYQIIIELSPKENLVEAAAHLFEALHDLEASGVKGIIARLAPESGLGVAINDRLRRASVTLR